MIASTNPASGATFARYDEQTPDQIAAVLDRAAAAQRDWRWVTVDDRLALLRRIAAGLRGDIDTLAAIVTAEMGKPIAEARAEVEKCATNCDFYADNAAAMLADTPVKGMDDAVIAHQPLGVVLAIMPWNYPIWQVLRFLAPAFAAGNGAVLKHAANVPQCALAIERIVREAGAPEGLFGNLLIGSDAVAGVIADDRIAAVTLTGSTEVGMKVAAQAGSVLKKQVLELGGSDPFVVLADADIAKAAATAAKARFTNAGQSCINAKRFIVEAAVADRFVAAFEAEVAKLRLGDPTDAATTLGPLARANLRATIDDQVQRSVQGGAKLVCGGKLPDGPGFFYPPTILDGVAPGMAAFDEETFGPAAAIVHADNEDAAIELANRTSFGLGSSIWTTDLDRGAKLARRIEAGAVFVNAMVASDPRAPFGGIKHSGYGRELGELGLKEFTNAKTIRVANG